MPNKNDRILVFLFLAALAVWPGLSQENSPKEAELSARDMFQKAAGRLVPGRSTPSKKSTSKTAQPSGKTGGGTASDSAKRRPSSPGTETVEKKTPPADNKEGQTKVVPVSLNPSNEAVPLGLRYAILKQTGESATEVDPDTDFRSGDRIRLSIQSSGPAYLYIVQQGTSGNWNVLFPSPEIANGNNRIEPGHNYSIPPRHWFAFDEQVGEERLFLMLSRQPENDLESLIYSLRPGGTSTPAAPERPRQEGLVMAENIRPVDDGLISQLRSEVHARDLVFEKVDDETAGQVEKAVYIVNSTAAEDSRVVADLTLKHR